MFSSLLWPPQPAGAPSARRRVLLSCSAAAIAALTLGPKVAYYARTEVPLQVQFETKVKHFVMEAGWLPVGEKWLASDLHRAVHYVSQACPEGAWIAVLPVSGEANKPLNSLIRRGDHLFFVYGGKPSDTPPRYAYLQD